ncbi:hypothetical protein ACLB1O_32185 [Escherichia coli]
MFQLAFRVLVKAADPDVADAVPLDDVSLVEGGLSALSVPLCLKAHFCQAERITFAGMCQKMGKQTLFWTKRRGPA